VADLIAAPLVVMRVPIGGEGDRRSIAAQAEAMAKHQGFKATASPHAQGMPLWRPVPISLIPDVLLDHLIVEAQTVLEAEARP
jgi:hypothetical protein